MAWSVRTGFHIIGRPPPSTTNPSLPAEELGDGTKIPQLRVFRKRMFVGDRPFTEHTAYLQAAMAAGWDLPIPYLDGVANEGLTSSAWIAAVEDWVEAMRAIGVQWFEIGNEIEKTFKRPDGTIFQSGDRYWQRLAEASPIIRAAGGRVMMSSAGTGWGGGDAEGTNFWRMLQAAHNRGGVFPLVDGIAIHLYSGADRPVGSPTAPSAATGKLSPLEKMETATALMDDYGGYPAQLEYFCTETGWASGPEPWDGHTAAEERKTHLIGTETQQRDRFDTAYTDADWGLLPHAKANRLRAIAWFTDRDYSPDDGDPERWVNYCGGVEWAALDEDAGPDGAHKAIYARMQTVGPGTIDANLPDIVSLDGAVQVGPTTATISAHIHPHGLGTRYFVQWGAGRSGLYDRISPIKTGLNGASSQAVTLDLSGLPTSGTINYRVVAINDAGQDYSAEASFDMAGVTTGSKDFSEIIRNLVPGQTYYFKAMGETSTGEDEGDILSFIAQGPAAEPAAIFLPALILLRCSIEIESSAGRFYQWDLEDPNPKNRPQNLRWNTAEGDGFADGSVELIRPIGLDYADLRMLQQLRAIDAAGEIAFDGMIVGTPRSAGEDGERIQVQFYGRMQNARERPFVRIFVDASGDRWQPPSLALRKAVMNDDSPLDADYNATVDTGSIHFKGQASGASSQKSIPVGSQTIVVYRAPDGERLTRFGYKGEQRNIASEEGPRLWASNDDTILVGAWDDDAAVGEVKTLVVDGTLQPVAILDQPRQYMALRMARTSVGSPPTKPAMRRYDRIAVYGDHDLALRDNGENPPGVYASDAFKSIINDFCPLLDASEIAETSDVIAHLAFTEPTKPYDALLKLNGYQERFILGAWEGGKIQWEPVDLSDADWQCRKGDPGVVVELAGETTDDWASGIVVSFTDLSGRDRILWPDEQPQLRDDDPNNPAVREGRDVWAEISISTPVEFQFAMLVGAAQLADLNHPKAPGSVQISSGYIQSIEGHFEPAHRVRYGHRLSITNLPNDEPRLVNSTSWDESSAQLSIQLEKPPSRVEAVLARLAGAIEAAGIS